MAGAASWRLRDRELRFDRPIVVGILNVTPDSFSDGGRFASVDDAVAHAARLLAEGADVIDVGGESTRPQGAVRVDAGEEVRRVVPVVSRLRAEHPEAVISVDTTKHEVAAAVLDAGADAVNDVSGFRLDRGMASMCAAARCGVVLMHSRGGVSEMGTFAHASYGDDAVAEVFGELRASVRAALDAGVAAERIVVDPGVGFAKRSEHSLAVLARLPELVEWGHPVMVGVSRKRFIGEITGVTNAAERVYGTVGANVAALVAGARLFRVHDVAANRQALDVAWAVMRAGATPTGATRAGGRA
jgi:dihydropteroate synthase